MKKIYFSILIILSIQFNIQAQNTGFNFQGVARNPSGVLLSSQKITLKFTLLQGSATGIPEYEVIRAVNTNSQGVFSIIIGDTIGIISTQGNFNDINWKQFPKFLKVEMDPNAGLSFTVMGTTQLLSVPYAKIANFAASADALNLVGLVPVANGGTGLSSPGAAGNKLVSDGTSWVSESLPKHKIGDVYGGGVVFYVTSDSLHGLIAETRDQTFSSTFYDAENYISDFSFHSNIGRLYTDWRLPTKHELNLLYRQKTIVGGFPVTSSFYWSSTIGGNSTAWYQDFRNGAQGVMTQGQANAVRAVRSF
jgi:hypothetical protein